MNTHFAKCSLRLQRAEFALGLRGGCCATQGGWVGTPGKCVPAPRPGGCEHCGICSLDLGSSVPQFLHLQVAPSSFRKCLQ